MLVRTIEDQVQCVAGRITHIDMHYQGLPGSGGVPLALLELTGLTFLSLHGNQVTGTVPATLVQLTGLTALGLEDNQLTAHRRS